MAFPYVFLFSLQVFWQSIGARRQPKTEVAAKRQRIQPHAQVLTVEEFKAAIRDKEKPTKKPAKMREDSSSSKNTDDNGELAMLKKLKYRIMARTLASTSAA